MHKSKYNIDSCTNLAEVVLEHETTVIRRSHDLGSSQFVGVISNEAGSQIRSVI